MVYKKQRRRGENMDKDKKYNAILGIMIFLFLIILGVALAWGLGYISINIGA